MLNMSLLIARSEAADWSQKYIFVDNDVLLILSTNEEFAKDFFEVFQNARLTLDPFTEIEFLRGTYLLDQIKIKEQIISTAFEVTINHQDHFIKLQQNFLILSQIYRKKQQALGASFVDLMIAARAMLNAHNSLLLTGNRKDFPPCLFDTVMVINQEKPSGETRNFHLLSFNIDHFKKEYVGLQLTTSKASQKNR